jgi:hypothetical protein
MAREPAQLDPKLGGTCTATEWVVQESKDGTDVNPTVRLPGLTIKQTAPPEPDWMATCKTQQNKAE